MWSAKYVYIISQYQKLMQCYNQQIMAKMLHLLILILAFAHRTLQASHITDTSSEQFRPEAYKGGQQRVVDLFSYNGEDKLLQKKLQLTENYVDYFYIFQALYSFEGNLKGLTYNKMNFLKHQSKIIYVPIRNFPHIGENLTQKQIQENQNYFYAAFGTFFSTTAAEKTTIILSQIDAIVKKQDIASFKDGDLNSACMKSFSSENQAIERLRKVRLLKFSNVIGKGLIETYFDASVERNCQSKSSAELNSKLSKQSPPSSEISFKNKTQYMIKTKKRLVIQCTPFNGQSHIFSLKLEIQKQFVDYYFVTQSPYTHTGVQKGIEFDISIFGEYAHKIIYIPLLTLPFLYNGRDLTWRERWQNEYYMRNQASLLLRVFARPQDIILVSDMDQIISKEGLQQFNPQKDKYAFTQMRQYYFYYNRRSVFDSFKKAVKNYAYQCTRILFYEYLQSNYSLQLSRVRREEPCNFNDRQIDQTQGIKCSHKILRFAGWHFSYVLNDGALIKKLRSVADSKTSKITIFNFTEARWGNVIDNCYLQQQGLIEANLPYELVSDVVKYKQKSKYAEFLGGIDYESLNFDQKTLQQLRSKQYIAEINTHTEEQTGLLRMRMQYLQQKHKLFYRLFLATVCLIASTVAIFLLILRRKKIKRLFQSVKLSPQTVDQEERVPIKYSQSMGELKN